MKAKEYRDRVLRKCKGKIQPLEDGYMYFCIKGQGVYSAHNLRIIADEIERQNEAWDEEVTRELSAQTKLEKNYESLVERHRQEIEDLQRTCPHDEIGDWTRVAWAPGHMIDDEMRFCVNCRKLVSRRKISAQTFSS